mmetsp:Transcript_32736/g.90408  ORF Transcript_32736/g.90408 Transcript_32736/m.90408 type:complete len:380 (-) Transcript_32736:12-1151(-)
MSLAGLTFQDCTSILDGEEESGSTLFHHHKVEAAASLALLFAFLTAIGIVFCVDPEDLQEARKWAKQPWVESFCTVEDAGIAYRGNCDTDATLTMVEYRDFAECMGPDMGTLDVTEVHLAWEASAPGRCALRGNDAFAGAAGPARRLGSSAYRPEHAPPRRRLDSVYRPKFACHNSFLPWAVVRAPNASGGKGVPRCAYEFGASRPSITGDWLSVRRTLEHLRRARGVRGGVVCWVLGHDDCVVAFHDRRLLEERALRERDRVRMHVTACGLLAALLASCAARWHCQKQGLWPSQPRGYHMPLPTAEPDHAALLNERVQQTTHAAVQRLAEATPPGSGASTLRISGAGAGHRTVEVVLPNGNRSAVSQNIATDFLDALK